MNEFILRFYVFNMRPSILSIFDGCKIARPINLVRKISPNMHFTLSINILKMNSNDFE